MMMFVLVPLACWSDVAVSASSETVMLAVKNMTCEVCPLTVKKAFEKVPGVNGVKVDFSKKSTNVVFHSEKVIPEMLVKATTDAGYPSVMAKE